MDTKTIKEQLDIIDRCNKNLYYLEERFDELKFELRVFDKDNQWYAINYNSNYAPAKNYIKVQLIKELKDKIQKSKQLIKEATVL